MPTDEEQRKDPSVQAKRAAKWQTIASSWALLAAVAGLLTAGEAFIRNRTRLFDTEIFTTENTKATDELATLTRHITELQNQTNVVAKLSDDIKSAPPAISAIANLTTQLSALQNEVKSLNDAIGKAPEKALAVPMLRKDLDNLQESNRQEWNSAQVEITRVYDQDKWFIGLMFTMALSLLGLAVSNFLRPRKP